MPPDYDYHARTAADAIRLLETKGVRRISLDHDWGDDENGTGYEVAKWIEAMAFAWAQGDEGGFASRPLPF